MKPKVGDTVLCGKGTKSGTGVVASVYPNLGGYLVDFPEQPYPQTMVTISGSYIIPECDISEVKEAGE